MATDPDITFRLRQALERDEEKSPRLREQVSPASPPDVLFQLASSGRSESVRLAAARTLIELAEKGKARKRTEAALEEGGDFEEMLRAMANDPTLTGGQRLKAIELLHDQPAKATPEDQPSEEDLIADFDAYLVGLLQAMGDEEVRERFPTFDRYLDELTQRMAREHLDQAEVERRARELFEEWRFDVIPGGKAQEPQPRREPKPPPKPDPESEPEGDPQPPVDEPTPAQLVSPMLVGDPKTGRAPRF